jgi:homospermidine synthase
MIISRKFMVEDINGIDDIYQKQNDFGVPSLENVVINSTLVDSVTGKIVGYGAVKIFAEAILLLDKELGKKEKSQAVREAMKTAIVYSKDAGIEYLYMITKSESFSKVLRQNYLAERVPGETLMINLGSDRETES